MAREQNNTELQAAPWGFARLGGWDRMEWEPYAWEPERQPQIGRPSGAKVATLARRVMAGVCALSRRAMAIERARALGRKRVDLRAWALEQAARRWAQERAGQK